MDNATVRPPTWESRCEHRGGEAARPRRGPARLPRRLARAPGRFGCPRAASPRCWVATASGRRPRCRRSWASSVERTGEPRRRGHQPGRRTGSCSAALATSPRIATSSPGSPWRRTSGLAERNGAARYELVYDLFPELKQRARQRAQGRSRAVSSRWSRRPRTAERQPRPPDRRADEGARSPFLVTEVARALEHAAEATTILLVEQNLGVVQRLAARCRRARPGRVVHTGPVRSSLPTRRARPAPARCRWRS